MHVYEVEGLGTCRLFVHSEKSPFIYLLVDGKYTIINFEDSAKTMAIYEELKKAIKKKQAQSPWVSIPLYKAEAK